MGSIDESIVLLESWHLWVPAGVENPVKLVLHRVVQVVTEVRVKVALVVLFWHAAHTLCNIEVIQG